MEKSVLFDLLTKNTHKEMHTQKSKHTEHKVFVFRTVSVQTDMYNACFLLVVIVREISINYSDKWS